MKIAEEFKHIDSFIQTLKQLCLPELASLVIEDSMKRNQIYDENIKQIEIISLVTVCGAAIKKYNKHAPITSAALKSINCFLNHPSLSDHSFQSVYKFSRKCFIHIMNEWNLIKKETKSETFEPNIFWESKKKQYPNLIDLVFRLFSIKAGISGIERYFAKWRATQTEQRQSLNPENLEKILFLKFNSHFLDIYRNK